MKKLYLSLLIALSATQCYAMPTPINESGGSSSVSGNTRTFNATSTSSQANYNTFNLQSAETYRVNQPTTDSLHLINIQNNSVISGIVSSNGNIAFNSPNGLTFSGVNITANTISATAGTNINLFKSTFTGNEVSFNSPLIRVMPVNAGNNYNRVNGNLTLKANEIVLDTANQYGNFTNIALIATGTVNIKPLELGKTPSLYLKTYRNFNNEARLWSLETDRVEGNYNLTLINGNGALGNGTGASICQSGNCVTVPEIPPVKSIPIQAQPQVHKFISPEGVNLCILTVDNYNRYQTHCDLEKALDYQKINKGNFEIIDSIIIEEGVLYN